MFAGSVGKRSIAAKIAGRCGGHCLRDPSAKDRSPREDVCRVSGRYLRDLSEKTDFAKRVRRGDCVFGSGQGALSGSTRSRRSARKSSSSCCSGRTGAHSMRPSSTTGNCTSRILRRRRTVPTRKSGCRSYSRCNRSGRTSSTRTCARKYRCGGAFFRSSRRSRWKTNSRRRAGTGSRRNSSSYRT